MKDTSIYYNINDLMGFDKLVYIIVGARSIGKTYGLKKYALNQYIRKGKQFIYMKRTSDDIKETMSKFFDDLYDEFPGYTFDIRNGNMYFYKTECEDFDDFDIEDYCCGYYRAVSQVMGKKSVPYPNVNTIIYDEFMTEPGQWKIKNEPHHLMEFYYTVSRLRQKGNELRLFMISNAISITNEYFRYFGLEIKEGETYGFYQKGEVVLHISDSKAFKNKAKQNRTYQLYQQTGYADYAIDNKFFYDNSNFIGKRPDDLIYKFTIVYDGIMFGVWERSTSSMLYVDGDKVDKVFPIKIAVTSDSHDNGTVFSKRINDNPYLKLLETMYDSGLVGFDKIDTKNIIQNIMFKRV